MSVIYQENQKCQALLERLDILLFTGILLMMDIKKEQLMEARASSIILVRPYWGRQNDSFCGLLSYFDVKDIFQVDAGGNMPVFGVEDVESIEDTFLSHPDSPKLIVRLKGFTTS
jgi:hypothetical protein